METDLTFGKYIIKKRMEADLSARQLAKNIGISPVYMCDIEKDRKAGVKREVLDKMASIFMLTKEERELFYDLAGKAKNNVSVDLPEYIMENDMVRVALRTAKEHDATDKEWMEFVEKLKKRKE